MAPKRATRSTPVTTTPAPTATTTTTVTNAQLQAMIDQGVSAALAARDANRNGVDSRGYICNCMSGDLNALLESTDVVKYNQRFQELALLCVRMFPEESDKIERYVGGLPDMIHGNIVASKPKTMQVLLKLAPELMTRESYHAERQAKNKRNFENTNPKQT
ncbi:hypothetical protein Tco_0831134 [Tanacetum coccineum]